MFSMCLCGSKIESTKVELSGESDKRFYSGQNISLLAFIFVS
jgi:hypothetical protein